MVQKVNSLWASEVGNTLFDRPPLLAGKRVALEEAPSVTLRLGGLKIRLGRGEP